MKLLRLIIFTLGLCGSLAFGDFISISPDTITGGNSSVVTVTLPSPAPAGGTRVNLSSNSPASVDSVTVPAGSTTATTPVNTIPVLSDTDATINASGGGLTGKVTLHVLSPRIESVVPSSGASLPGGPDYLFPFRVTLTGNAPSGLKLSISSSNADLVTFNVGFGVGTRSEVFNTYPAAVYHNEKAKVTVSVNGSSVSTVVTILAPKVSMITASPPAIAGGSSDISLLRVQLSSPAPTGGLDVPIGNNLPAQLSTPATLHFGGSTSSATFPASAPEGVDAAVRATVTANYNSTRQTVIQVVPSRIASVTLAPATVQGTSSTTATVTLKGKAGPSGLKVTLSSSSPATAAFSAPSLTIPAGQSSASVQVNTFHVDVAKVVTLDARLGTKTTADLNVVPPASIQSVSLDHTNVVGGSTTSVFGTVTLVSAAPSGGRTVTLSSSDPTTLKVPTTVTVPAGATQMGFAVTHSAVWVSKIITVTATLDSVVQTAAITVKPAGRPWTKYAGDARNTGRGNSTNATGVLAWKCNLNTYAQSPPVLGADGTVYLQANDEYLYAIRGTNGSIKWRFHTFTKGFYTSPLIGSDGTIYQASAEESTIYAITPAGNQKWTSRTPLANIGPLALSNDGKLLFAGCGQWMHAYDTSDGTEKWTYGPVDGDSVLSAPAIGADGTVYYATGRGFLYALDPNTGAEKWHYEADLYSSLGTPCLDNGTVYVAGGKGYIYALNSLNGSPKWSYHIDGAALGSPIVGTDGTVYLGSENTNTMGSYYALSGNTGALKWRRTDIRRGPALAITDNGTLFLGSSDTYLSALDAATGATKWTFKVSSSPSTSFCAIGTDGAVYAIGIDGYLYKLK